jgi:hypothetical protein
MFGEINNRGRGDDEVLIDDHEEVKQPKRPHENLFKKKAKQEVPVKNKYN